MRIHRKYRLKFLRLRYRDFLRKDDDCREVDDLIQLFNTCLCAKHNITSAGFLFDCSRGKHYFITDFNRYCKRRDMILMDLDIARKCCIINKKDLLALKQYQFNPDIIDKITETSKIINSLILKENSKYKYYHQYATREEYSQSGFSGRRYYTIQTNKIKGLRFKKDSIKK